MAEDGENVFFYMQTEDNISPFTDQNWMMLFIDSDLDSSTGWEGYDFVVNRSVIDSNTTTLQKTIDGTTWTTVGTLDYSVVGNEMELAIPLDLIEQVGDRVSLYFHWADNVQSLDDISEFFLSGDSVSNRRFNYNYESLLFGDVDGDGDVDLVDKNIIRDHLFETGHSRSGGDLNGDGIVDFDDFHRWKEFFPGNGSSATVPEPGTFVMTLAGLCLLRCWGWQR